jgi:hypothetical protein
MHFGAKCHEFLLYNPSVCTERPTHQWPVVQDQGPPSTALFMLCSAVQPQVALTDPAPSHPRAFSDPLASARRRASGGSSRPARPPR